MVSFVEIPHTYKPRKRGKHDYLAYTEETLQKCLEAVRSGSLPIKKATKKYNIPKGTIQNKLKNIHSKSVRHPTVFTKLEEELFALSVKTMCNWGFLLDKLDLCMILNVYLMKQNRVLKEFANNIPRDDWVANFMGCHGSTNWIATNI